MPATALLELAGSWVNRTQIVIAPGGTLRLHSDGATADMGDIDVRGATVELSDFMTIAEVMQLQASDDTTFEFHYPDGGLDLQGGTWNLANVTGTWDLHQAAISNGTLTGLDGTNQVHLPDSFLSLGDLRLETPLEITAGNVTLSNTSVVAQPITVNGGALSLREDWTNESEIHVVSGELRLYALSSQPGTINMTGGTLYVGLQLNLGQLLALPVGSPDQVSVGTTLDLEGDTFDLGSQGWNFRVGGVSSGVVRNGTITDSSGTNPLQLHSGTLVNVEILADVVTGPSASLSGTSIVARRMTFSGNMINATATSLLLDDVTIDGGMSLGTGTTDVVNGLTVNGTLQLNTERVQMAGDQTIDGTGEITTNGFRSIPGGGLQMTGGVLTLGEGLTFHSRRRLSIIEATDGGIINRGTIRTGIDAYGESHHDLQGPSIIVRADTFEQMGTLITVDDYDMRVEVDHWSNEGTVDLQGGGLIVVGTSFRNGPQGQILGHGTLDVTATDFVNEGLVSPGASAGVLSVLGNYNQATYGTLAIEIGGAIAGSGFDQLHVSGEAALGGTLHVSLIGDFKPSAGYSFDIITATGAITGTFDVELLPTLGNGLNWAVSYGSHAVSLVVGLAGDYNADHMANAADYIMLRKLDASQAQVENWRRNFGRSSVGSGSTARVPEPATTALVWAALVMGCAMGRPRGHNREHRRATR